MLVLGVLFATATPVSAQEIVLRGKVVARFTGAPVPGACVALVDDQRHEVARTCADGNGDYDFADSVPPAHYRIVTTAAGFADTWYAQLVAVDARDFDSADPLWVPDAGFTNLGLRPAGVGALRGRLTDRGAAVAGQTVTYVDTDGNRWGSSTSTDADGGYAFAGLWPGHYQLEFTDNRNTQYYHQKESLADSDVIVVGDGPDTVVDEELIAPGTVEVTLTDANTGAPLDSFCAYVPGGVLHDVPCTTNGLLRFELPRGTYQVSLTPGPAYFPVDVRGVSVTPGRTIAVTAAARPAVAAHTTVRDATTGQPVAGTCVQAIEPTARSVPLNPERWCSDERGEITVGPLEKGRYRLLAVPGDGVHGMQWVRAGGGTGDQERAAVLHGNLGTVAQLADIRLDPAGRISGTALDARTGAPVPWVCVFPYATSFGYGDVCTDQTGHYEITGLGPYRWPLEFADTSQTYGWRWSGNADNRLQAGKIKVASGQTATADVRLRPARSVSGQVSVAGVDFSVVDVFAYDAESGDYAGPSVVGTPGYTLGNLGAGAVKLYYEDSGTGAHGWFRDATSFGTAKSVLGRPQGTTVADQVLAP